MGASCYRHGYERGPWFEMFCLRKTIAQLVAAGKDAEYEKHLLECWNKVPEYGRAVIPPDYLAQLLTLEKAAGLVTQGESHTTTPPAAGDTPDFDAGEFCTTTGPGRPRKNGEDISRWTKRRRGSGSGEKARERQGARTDLGNFPQNSAESRDELAKLTCNIGTSIIT